MALNLTIINNNDAVLSFNEDGMDILDNVDIQKIKDGNINKVFVKTDSVDISTARVATIYNACKKLEDNQIAFSFDMLPENIKSLLRLSFGSANVAPNKKEQDTYTLEIIGENGYNAYKSVVDALKFIKESMVSLWNFVNGKAIFRKEDFWFIFSDCSYKAIGIISLVSFLVGLILAFVGALQLRTFGAGVYVASMVALGMTRIMAAIMVGIIMAGRTGSSYAATIGTMQVNEEIDALKTLGIKITDYLVAPRIVSLVLTIPVLTLLADVLGIMGGAIVGVSFLDLSSTTYWEYSINALSLKNILIGLVHSFIYGIIISLCGCYEGLNAGRNADSVGKATTGAVVKALVWMIIATGILTVLLEVVGL